MTEQNDSAAGSRTEPGQPSKHQLKDAALKKLHRIEDSALDAYHTIEDHNARELRQDVKGVLTHLTEWFTANSRAFRSWYRAQPLYLQIAYGLTLVPVVIVLALLTLLLIKFGGPLLLATVLMIKLSLTLIKALLFLGYICYKILKTLIIWYYTLTRLYLGRKARNRRFAMARACEFALEPETLAAELTLHCHKKNLYIEHADKGRIRVLFSYLRYALVGHAELFGKLKSNWRHYLRIWEKPTRHELKALLAPLGDSLFSPHKLGAQVNSERVLVPGDAELLRIKADGSDGLQLLFCIRWVDWHFKLRKELKFLRVQREHHQDNWQVHALFKRDNETAGAVTDQMRADSVT